MERAEVARRDRVSGEVTAKVDSREVTISLRIDRGLRKRIEAVKRDMTLSEFVREAIEDRLSEADHQVRDLSVQQLSNAIGSVLKDVEDHTAELREKLQQLASPPVLMCYTCGRSYQITRGQADSILRSGGKGPQCGGCHDDDMVVREPKGVPAPAKRLIQGVPAPAEDLFQEVPAPAEDLFQEGNP